MSKAHTFFLPIQPRATQRNQCGCRAGRFPYSYLHPTYRAWKDEAVKLLAEIPRDPEWFADGPLEVSLEVIIAKPKTTKRAFPRGDRDNYEKGIFDAITQAGGWWSDDDQIVSGPFRKRWAAPGEPEGYLITIKEDPGADVPIG